VLAGELFLPKIDIGNAEGFFKKGFCPVEDLVQKGMFLQKSFRAGAKTGGIPKAIPVDEVTKIDRSCFRDRQASIPAFKGIKAYLTGRIRRPVMHLNA
jgi:hypothetical protein